MEVKRNFTKGRLKLERFRRLKKILFNSFLMACLLVAPMAINSSAETTTDTVGGITYSFDPTNVAAGATITAWEGATGAIEIPSTVTIGQDTYDVVAIGKNAFKSNTDITSVSIPANVTSIGDGAFDQCSNLATVNFAAGSQLTSIGGNAFCLCTSLDSISLPSGLSTISAGAFAYSGLSSIAIPAGVSSIGEMAFMSISSLASVTFASGSALTTIENKVFSGTGLTSVTIPAGVTSISTNAFQNCASLATVNFAAGTQVATIGESGFQSCGLTSITIPASVTSIDKNAFRECASLATVNFAAGSQLTTIGYGAFMNSGFSSFNMPEGVTTLDNSVFAGNTHLVSIVFPSTVTSVGDNTCSGCSSLGTVYAPSGLDLSGAAIKDSANIWRYTVDTTAEHVPTGKTAVAIASNDYAQSATTTMPCNAMGDPYVIRSVPAGITLGHGSNDTDYRYTWAADHSYCDAQEYYTDCGSNKGTPVRSTGVTPTITTPLTENANGVRTYTATFPNDIPDDTDTESFTQVPLTDNGSNSHDILGYQAEGQTQYMATIYWEDDAVFVYDRGQFDPNTGEYVSTLPLTDPDDTGLATQDMVELGGTAGHVNQWYGFDGWNNRVMVLNRSNDAITASYAVSNPQGGQVGQTTLKIYDYDANDYDENDNTKNGYAVQLITEASDDETTIGLRNGDPLEEYLHASADRTARFGNETEICAANSNTTKTLPSASNGTMYANKIFFNISGAPSNDFTTNQNSPASIGTITITLNKLNPVTP